jgi:hypothetical protein
MSKAVKRLVEGFREAGINESANPKDQKNGNLVKQ